MDDRLPEALVAGSPEVAARLVAQTVGALGGLPAADRAALLATVAALLAADGSPTGAAARLHCHRNTVAYRLARIEELTGRGVANPRDQLLWSLALMAVQQGGGRP